MSAKISYNFHPAPATAFQFLVRARLSLYEQKIAFFILLGIATQKGSPFKKSISSLSKELGIDRGSARRALSGLESKKILLIQRTGKEFLPVFSFPKTFPQTINRGEAVEPQGGEAVERHHVLEQNKEQGKEQNKEAVENVLKDVSLSLTQKEIPENLERQLRQILSERFNHGIGSEANDQKFKDLLALIDKARRTKKISNIQGYALGIARQMDSSKKWGRDADK